jgi:predicted nucleic acid-binding protein
MMDYSRFHISVSESIARRAEELESIGITGFDALHVAAAEAAKCDYLVTTDDGLQKKSKRHQGQLLVNILNPIHIISLP